jgi:hypothetical protein
MHIFLSNYWWQRSDIWSQASYRYPISWEVFLDPSDSYFLFADLVGFYTHWIYMLIFRRIFLSNYWWQESDIWSQASYRYPISWEAFLNPSDSYFLFADFVDFYTHLTYICICTFFVAFFSATIDDRNLIFGHKLHIGMPYCGKRFYTPAPRRGRGVYCFTSVRPSVCLSFHRPRYFSSYFSQQLSMAEIWYLVTSFI